MMSTVSKREDVGPGELRSPFGVTAKSNSDWSGARFVPNTARHCGHSPTLTVCELLIMIMGHWRRSGCRGGEGPAAKLGMA
jgi:hypothetical protein